MQSSLERQLAIVATDSRSSTLQSHLAKLAENKPTLSKEAVAIAQQIHTDAAAFWTDQV